MSRSFTFERLHELRTRRIHRERSIGYGNSYMPRWCERYDAAYAAGGDPVATQAEIPLPHGRAGGSRKPGFNQLFTVILKSRPGGTKDHAVRIVR